MKDKIMMLVKKTISLVLAIALFIPFLPAGADAADNTEPVIVVSLGDSYSSGEGIEEFYGQNKPVAEKVEDEDWLAHRSEKSWPGQLVIPGVTESGKTLKDYKSDEYNSSVCKWYFKASSGAVTADFNGNQVKKIQQKGVNGGKKYEKEMDPQLDVFDDIEGTVDYVTVTIGGNDVGFSDVVTTCALESSYLTNGAIFGFTGVIGSIFLNTHLEGMIEDLWDEIETYKTNIRNAYEDIKENAPDAEIIVAGYPQLLDANGNGLVISKPEATLINKNVSDFNDVLENLVEQCSEEGMKIHFVDVESAFMGHQAYTKPVEEQWINKVKFDAQDEDLDYNKIGSAYSMHPNEKGAAAYADCVNRKIEEIVQENYGTLMGKVCQASDRTTPIPNATIGITGDKAYGTALADRDGNYEADLPAGDYCVKISADGFIPFNAYANVAENACTYMETFLMVQGDETSVGTATGKITNALTGAGVEGVTLDIRKDWNNTSHGDVLLTATTGPDGEYTLNLPLGNYTVQASKAGFISGSVNIIVQDGTTSNQNGSISPIISGDDYRIVLTWGENPSDLDSHVQGFLSDGSSFHVYFEDKSVYDGDIEACNLDVDDTTSYGPETITLHTTSEQPYYYYIYNWSGNEGGTVGASEAKIKVYQGETEIAIFNVPTNQGDGRYWNVFAVVNGELVVQNTITSSADLSYASADGIAVRSLEETEVLATKSKEPIVEETEAAEETAVPTEETVAAAEETSEPTEQANDPTEVATEPTKETLQLEEDGQNSEKTDEEQVE